MAVLLLLVVLLLLAVIGYYSLAPVWTCPVCALYPPTSVEPADRCEDHKKGVRKVSLIQRWRGIRKLHDYGIGGDLPLFQ